VITEDRDTGQQQTPAAQLIDLREFVRILLLYKWLIAGLVVAGTVASVVIALMIPNVYRADTLLAPNEEQSGGGMAGLAEQYGGLAALAGIDLMSGSDEKTTLGLSILRSRKFFSDFVERHDILVPLMAAKGWDRESGELIIDADDYDGGDVRVRTGPDERLEVQFEVGAELQPAVGVLYGDGALDVVLDGLDGGVRDVVDGEDQDVVADSDSSVLTDVAHECCVCEIE
jgi:hypothetical protein